MRKTFLLCFLLLTSLLFGCAYSKDSNRDGNKDASFNNLDSFPPILADDSIPLETNKLDEEGMIELINMVSQNTWTGTGGNYSIEDANKISPITQVRKCINTNNIYSVYEKKQGRFYVFFGDLYGNTNSPYYMIFYCYSEQPLIFSDFDALQIGVSTIEDVKKIDKATSKYLDDGRFMPQITVDDTLWNENYSVHMTREGVVIIGYKETHDTLYVDNVTKQNNELISGINVLDLP